MFKWIYGRIFGDIACVDVQRVKCIGVLLHLKDKMWEKSCGVFFTGNWDEWCSWGWQKGMCIPEKTFYISFAVSQIRPHFTACWMCVWSSKYSCVCPKYVGAYLWVCLSFSLSVCECVYPLLSSFSTEKQKNFSVDRPVELPNGVWW